MSQDRTELAFLHDICQNPADDGVRLIYADWLDDRGLPGDAERAEFIRGQIALCCFPLALDEDIPADCPDEQLCNRLKGRAVRGDYPFLVPDWTQTPRGEWSWYGHGPQFAIQCGYFAVRHGYSAVRYPYPFTLHWRRGFVEAISISLVDFQAHAARLFASQPVQHVTLMDKKPTHQAVIEVLGEITVLSGERWAWLPYPTTVLGELQQAYHLPGYLFHALQGWLDTLFGWRFYQTQEEAQDALAQACVRWGRQQAGLLEGVAP